MRRNKISLICRVIQVCVGLTATNLILISPCISQQTAPAGHGFQLQIPGMSKRMKNTENPEFRATRLQKPVEIDVPRYSGKQVEFVVGTSFPQVKGGVSVTMEFSTADLPKKVLDWYKQTLQDNNWRQLENMTGANGLAYEKSHNIFQVMTMPPMKKGAKCDFLIRYKFYRPDSVPN